MKSLWKWMSRIEVKASGVDARLFDDNAENIFASSSIIRVIIIYIHKECYVMMVSFFGKQHHHHHHHHLRQASRVRQRICASVVICFIINESENILECSNTMLNKPHWERERIRGHEIQNAKHKKARTMNISCARHRPRTRWWSNLSGALTFAQLC